MARTWKAEHDGIDLITPVKLDESQKREYEKVLRRGNKVLKTYHARIKSGLSHRYSKLQFRKELFAAMKTANGSIIIRGVGISSSDLGLVRKVRDVEWTMLGSVARLIYQLSYKWSKKPHGSNLTFGDFYTEATMAVINAIYGFEKDEINFITYAHHAIKRRFMNATNYAKPFSPWSAKGQKLFGQFIHARDAQIAAAGIEVSFDSIVDMMNLDKNSIEILRAMTTNVVNNSDVSSEDNDPLSIPARKVEIAAINTDEILNMVPMSDWETEVMDAFLNYGYGWATYVADKCGYSRRAPKLALDRVLDRIKQTVDLADAA